MATFLHSLARGLFVCLIAHVVAGESVTNSGLLYKLTSTKRMYLESLSANTTLNISAEMLLRPYKILENSYLAVIQAVQMSIDYDNKSINLTTCTSFADAALSIVKPFIIVHDSNGKLKYIKVNKSEVDLSVNLKLLASSIVQTDEAKLKLNQSTYTVSTNELLFVGNCDIDYDVNKEKVIANLENITTHKNYSMETCTEVKSQSNGETDNLGNSWTTETCNAESDKKFKWLCEADVLSKYIDLSSIVEENLIQNIVLNELISYKPWKNSTDSIILDLKTNIYFSSIVVDGQSVEFEDDESTIVQKMWYKKANETILRRTENEDIKSLWGVYSALVCDVKPENIYMDIYERAIQCLI